MINIVPATRQMIEHLDNSLSKSVHAFAAVDGDRVLGITGVYITNRSWVIFSTLTDELRQNKRIIIKGYRMIMDVVKRRKMPVYSLACPNIEGSAKLLEHIGFTRLTGDLFVWRAEA